MVYAWHLAVAILAALGALPFILATMWVARARARRRDARTLAEWNRRYGVR